MFKAIGAAIVVGVGYIDQNLSPLFWALLVLAALDVVLNAHREGQQFQKIGSAFASLGGVTVLEGHLGNPDIVKISVAVLVLAYLQVVVPQLIAMLKQIKFSASKKVNAAEQQLASQALQLQASQIAAMVRQQLASDGVTTQATQSATATTVSSSIVPSSPYHV